MRFDGPEGALGYLQTSTRQGRWIYDEIDLERVRSETPERLVIVRSRMTRTELAAKLLSCVGESERAACVQVAEALICGKRLGEVFELATRLGLTDERRAWLARECETLKLRVQVFGVAWLTSAWIEVDSETEGLEAAQGYEHVDRCTFFRGDEVVAEYRMREEKWVSEIAKRV